MRSKRDLIEARSRDLANGDQPLLNRVETTLPITARATSSLLTPREAQAGRVWVRRNATGGTVHAYPME